MSLAGQRVLVMGMGRSGVSAARYALASGADVTVTGAPSTLKVNDASVACGGVQTANAEVYLIDTVLMPPAA